MIMWIDTETTGLIPERGHLLELAMVLTDDNLNERACFTSLIQPVGLARTFDDLTQPMDDYVRNMHTENGLIAELMANESHGPQRVAHHALEFFANNGPMDGIPLAGSTVGFDRAWLKYHMPFLERVFHYRSIDVSSIKLLANRWSPEMAKNRPRSGKPAHRALDDVRESITELKYYRSHFMVCEIGSHRSEVA